MPDEARLFWSGRSQAVRLPKAYRFEGDRVRIRRDGDAVIIEPVADAWAWLDKLGPFDDDAAAAALMDMPQQERPELDRSFE